MPESAVELEQRAERAVRRGELPPPGDRADLGSAEQLPVPSAAHGAPRAPARSQNVAHANFAPLPGERRREALPRDPVKMLEMLLERIRAGRRMGSTRP